MTFHYRVPSASAAQSLPATHALRQLDDVTFDNIEHGWRHPSAIYSVSLRTLVETFHDALNSYEAAVAIGVNAELPPPLQKSFVLALDRLLDAVAEHFDDARACLALVLKDLEKKAQTKHLRDYDDSIRAVRAFCCTQVNEMKHRQGRLHLIRIDTPLEVVWGYFVQGIGKHGDIGPNPRVHKTNTAFSMGRAFRMVAASILFTSKALATALARHPTHRLTASSPGFGGLLSVVNRLAALPRMVYWDELEVCPDFQVSAEAIEVKLPASRRWKRPPLGSRVQLGLTIEGLSHPYRLPYMGEYWVET